MENAPLEAATAVTDRYASRLERDSRDGQFVRVAAGTEFYVYTMQALEPDLASIAGLKQGGEALNSWDLANREYQRAINPDADTVGRSKSQKDASDGDGHVERARSEAVKSIATYLDETTKTETTNSSTDHATTLR